MQFDRHNHKMYELAIFSDESLYRSIILFINNNDWFVNYFLYMSCR